MLKLNVSCFVLGIPVFIALFCCFTSVLSCAAKKREKHSNSRRVSPINGDMEGSRIHNVTISQDSDMYTYDGAYSGQGGGGGLETQPQYGWDF